MCWRCWKVGGVEIWLAFGCLFGHPACSHASHRQRGSLSRMALTPTFCACTLGRLLQRAARTAPPPPPPSTPTPPAPTPCCPCASPTPPASPPCCTSLTWQVRTAGTAGTVVHCCQVLQIPPPLAGARTWAARGPNRKQAAVSCVHLWARFAPLCLLPSPSPLLLSPPVQAPSASPRARWRGSSSRRPRPSTRACRPWATSSPPCRARAGTCRTATAS